MSVYEIGLYISYILLVVGFLALLVGVVRTVMHDRSSGLQTLAGIGFLLIVFVIGYATASGALTPEAIADGITTNKMKMYDGAMKTLYALLVLGVLALVVDVVKSIVQG